MARLEMCTAITSQRVILFPSPRKNGERVRVRGSPHPTCGTFSCQRMFFPDDPLLSCGHPLPLPRAKDSGEGELFVGRRDDKRLICENKQLLIAGMSPPLRQAKCFGRPLLFGCVVAWLLPMKTFSAEPSETNDVNRLKPNQALSTNTPPASPEVFNPDPNQLNLPVPPQTDFHWTRSVIVSTNSGPSPQFNPDPGASLRPATNLPAALFDEPSAPPLFTPPEIPPDRSLPRENVRAVEMVPPTNPPPRSFGSGPLPDGLALPRDNTRRELKIYQDFSLPDYSLRNGDYPTNTVPRPDRWRIGFVPWKRYTSGVAEQPYETPEPMLWSPYKQSLLKGDLPIIGRIFFSTSRRRRKR